MDERSRSETLRSNERIKAISTILSNLGTALTATFAGRWFLNGFDGYVLIWIVVAMVLIWSGWHVLTMLEAEA
jgi:hypothetical protein